LNSFSAVKFGCDFDPFMIGLVGGGVVVVASVVGGS